MRHGETKLNVAGKLQGRTDEPLNENGIKLAKDTGEALKEIDFDLVITSPLIRARRTGELVIAPSEAFHHKKVPVRADDRFQEINFGSWEGHSSKKNEFDLPGISYEEFQTFFSDPFSFPGAPGGETISDVIARTDPALQEVMNTPEYQDMIILIATHGSALRSMLNRFYDDPKDFWQGHTPYNCAVSILKVENGRQELVGHDKIFYDPSMCVDHYK